MQFSSAAEKETMRMFRFAMVITLCASAVTVGAATGPSDLPQRVELKRADLSGAPDMEVITSISEFRKGESIPRHFHHGIETGYVMQGSMVQLPGKDPTMMETGTPIMNLRDVPHAGFTVVGDTPLRLLTVHIVDKNKPLYVWVN
jgi:quercetin dioxygenase-like cupin family protein